MSRLRQLLADHGPLLLLDASSAQVQVGVLNRDGSALWETSGEEAGIGLFKILEVLAFAPGAAGAYVYCHGPGSILGTRTVAAALRSWVVLHPKPAFAYNSLEIVAHALGRKDVAVISDARRESWHYLRLGEPMRRVPTAELSGEIVMPEGFRHWSTLPPHVARVPYSLADLLPRIQDSDIFHPSAEPDAFLYEEPQYVTWTPQIHRAPAAS